MSQLNEKITELYNKLVEPVVEVRKIFDDFYGKDKVDLQGFDKSVLVSKLRFNDLASFAGTKFFETSRSYEKYKYILITDLKEEVACQFIDDILNSNHEISYLRGTIYNNNDDTVIMVYYPNVLVTNENNKSIVIDDLYVKVPIKYDGKLLGYFSMNRAMYTKDQFDSYYLHSHCPRIVRDNLEEFLHPCLGTGPIRNTISTLILNNDPNIWNLFCIELDNYVHTESIKGGPYIKLEEVRSNDYRISIYCWFNNDSQPFNNEVREQIKFKEFINYFIKNYILSWKYCNGVYSIGEDLRTTLLIISNAFIKFYNDNYKEGKVINDLDWLLDNGVLLKCKAHNNTFYKASSRRNNINYSEYIGKHICSFKRKDIKLNILETNNIDIDNNYLYLLNNDCINYITTLITKFVNLKYGQSYKGNYTTNKKIYFI